MKVYFVGAGPGDPELLTLKAYKLLKSADCVIFPGSLINKEILKITKGDLYDSSKMCLEELITVMEKYIKENKKVVRLVSGDPFIYSAIQEQIEILREKNIPYEVIPGISSAMAGAAKMGIELTLPEISNSVIFTRIEGKTSGASSEEIKSFAKTNSTLVFFLSAGLGEKLEKTLLEALPPETPIIIAYKVTQKGEKIIFGNLKDLSKILYKNNIKKTALIYVGEALRAFKENLGKKSKLYNKNFKNGKE